MEGVSNEGIEDVGKTLGRSLGPEIVLRRRGEANTTVPYLEGHRAISLANAIFGYGGWSSQIMDSKVENEERGTDGNLFVEVTVTCRITLAARHGGVFKENIGHGSHEKMKQRGKAKEKALKEAVTDALKRVLRQFGEAMGNCMYNKEYIAAVTKVRSVFKRIRFNEDQLYRLQVNRKRNFDGNVKDVGANSSEGGHTSTDFLI
jgi:DNA repair and recombination protein RAD52